MRESLERRLTTERPNGTYDDTRAGHDAFSRGVVKDYDHGNHHLARATIRVADPGLVTGAALSALGLPDTDAPIIDELARASAANTIAGGLADAALLDLDRYATGRGLRYSRVGTALMLVAPNEQRLADAIDTVAAAAINSGACVTDVTTQYIDEEKSLGSIGIEPWTAQPIDEPMGQADRILYVGRDGARIHVKAGRVLVDAPGSLPSTSLPKNSVTRVVLSGNVSLSAGARSWAMRSGVEVVCLSRRGSYQGALIGANRGTHASRRLAQVALTGDHERRVHLAASLIGAKIRSQIHVLTRIARCDKTVMALLRTRKLRPEHGVVEAEAGECGWAAMARKSSLTCTRSPASDLSPVRSPDTRDRGAGTSLTPCRCWRAPSPNLTTTGAESLGDNLHHCLRHRRQQTTAPRRQNTGILRLPHPRVRVPTPPRHRHAGARACSACRPHLRRRRRHPHLPHLLILRRPRRHARRSHSARRRGIVSGSVVRG